MGVRYNNIEIDVKVSFKSFCNRKSGRIRAKLGAVHFFRGNGTGMWERKGPAGRRAPIRLCLVGRFLQLLG